MDVSPKTLREVEFREKMRGYHPEDVDQFLERVAAGIEVLQDRLRQAIERAQRAEQAANDAGGTDDALRRTLLLAQRTADLAIQEAREQAARIVTGAEQEAQQLLADAEQQVRTMVSDAERRSQAMLADSEHRSLTMVSEAEQRARRGHEDTLVEVRAELAKLEVTRQRLQMDVDALSRWVADHRSQLRAALEDALARAEQLDVSPPPVSGAPYPFDDSGSRPAPAVGSAASGAPAPGGQASGMIDPVPATSTPGPGPSGVAGGMPVQSAPVSAWAPPPTTTSVPQPAAAPVTQAAQPSPPAAAEEGADADPYFAELRRAISDNDPLGPRPQEDAGGD